MICYYIDHETYDKIEDLARLSLEYKHSDFLSPQDGISLLTCHRVEFYLPAKNALFLKKLPGYFYEIKEADKSYRRIFEIELGLHSQIIGENSIFQQVSQGINAYLYYSQNSTLLKILKIAKKIRDEFEFYAPNHGQLVYEVFKSGNSKTLILVGAGMLNCKILDTIQTPTTYTNIILVTRDKKKARQRLFHTDAQIDVVSIEDITVKSMRGMFDVIIATNDLNNKYVRGLVGLCGAKECVHIADLSSTPLPELKNLKSDINYYSLFTENMTQIIEEQNLLMIPKKKLISDYLIKQNINFS